MSQIIGHISQVIGPVVDVFFDAPETAAELVLRKLQPSWCCPVFMMHWKSNAPMGNA